MTGTNWVMFAKQCINKFHICTVSVKKSDTSTDNRIIQVSMSNGLVLEEFYGDEAGATMAFKLLTGVTE